MGKTVSFVTMGCAKNEVDSDHMATRLALAGYDVIDDPEAADAVVVNTCSFIQAATEESIEAILEVAGYDSVAQGRAHLIVSGCMPSRYGDELAGELPEASSFVPCADESSIVDVMDGLFGIARATGSDIAKLDGQAGGRKRVSAYVKISDGCDRFCSYCTIPFIRGRYRSFPEEEIRAEIDRNRALGAREIVLIAQDTGRWGTDFEEPSTLARLMGNLAEAYPDMWFRVMYVQPEGVTDELVEAAASHGNICPYFDIPFQHASARVLRLMNRRGSAHEHLGLIARIRAALPHAVLRTTLIAGFPGETEDEFQELCDFVEEADLDYVGVFAYSREDGTRADKLDGHLDEDEKLSRAQALRDLADSLCTARLANRVGQEADVLVCGTEEDGQLFGRTMWQAPDVDGVTYVDMGQIGDIVHARIEDTLFYEVEGTVLS